MSNEKEEKDDKEEKYGEKVLPPEDSDLRKYGSGARKKAEIRELEEAPQVDEEKGE